MPVQLYQTEWERRKIRNRVHLTMGEGACLGPCSLANITMLIFDGAAVWLQNMHTDAQVLALYDYIEAMIAANTYLPPPPALAPYVFQAYDWQTQKTATPAPLPPSPTPIQIRPATADFVFLTHADTDLLILDKAKALLPTEFAAMRGFNAAEFDTRAKVDAFILDEVSEVKIVLARLLTLDDTLLSQLRDHCVEYGKALVLVSGTDVPDIGLAKFSTVSPAVQTDTLGYFRAGGASNLAQLLRFLSDHLLATGFGYEPPMAQAQLGLARPFVKSHNPNCLTIGILFYRAYHLSGNMAFVDALIHEIEAQGAQALPIYVPATKEANLAALGLEGVADVFISTLANAGLWRDTATNGTEGAPAGMIGDCVVIQAPISSSTRTQWEASMRGLNPRDTITTVVLPEFDGAIIGPPIAFKQDHALTFEIAPDRIRRVVGIAVKWAALRHKPNAEKRVAFVLTNASAKAAKIGNAVGLDAPASLTRLLSHMQQAGYVTGDWEHVVREWAKNSGEDSAEDSGKTPMSLSDALIHMLIARGSYDKEFLADFQLEQAIGSVGKNDYARWHNELTQLQKQQMDGRWGEPPGGAFHHQGKLVFAGLQFEQVFIGLQPPRGYGMDPRLIYHTPDLSPTHHYHAFYTWLAKPQAEGGWGADAIVHMGKHGTLEWLPGKSLGLSQHCYPDTFLADVPLIYPFILNDPGEGMQAKRRAHAVIVDHLTPPLTNAELYDELNELLQLVDEYYQLEATDPSKLPSLQRQIWDLMKKAHLDDDLQRLSQKQAELHGHTWDMVETDAGVPVTLVEMQGIDFSHMLEDIQGYLCELHGAQIRDGLHILGEIPSGEALGDLLFALTRLPNLNIPSLRDTVAANLGVSLDDKRAMLDVDVRCRELIRDFLSLTPRSSQLGGEKDSPPSWEERGVGQTLTFIRDTLLPNLRKTDAEIHHVLRALAGKPIPPGPSGAPTRGMAHVLPTGRNFYSLDPRAVPSQLAWRVGQTLADQSIERYRQETGKFPETVGLTLWGTSAMRTHGDDVAQALALMGVRPIWQTANRRVTGVALIPLSELGRPRVNVLMRISGMFRDAYPHLIELLDDAVKLATECDEPLSQNAVLSYFVNERARLLAQGLTDSEALNRARYRIFGSKPGAYGAGILPLIEEGNWKDINDFAQVFVAWGGYAYTREVFGVDARDEFKQVLRVTQVAIKNQDNREHDIYDSDDYLQFHGGMIAAIRSMSGVAPKAYFGDSSDPARSKVRDLRDESTRVFRSRVANPKWITSMMRHGYKGGLEMAATVDYLFGYDATSDVLDDWQYADVAQKYTLDKHVQDFLKQSNPWALQSMLRRLLEAIERGMWAADDDMKQRLLAELAKLGGDLEDWMEMAWQKGENLKLKMEQR